LCRLASYRHRTIISLLASIEVSELPPFKSNMVTLSRRTKFEPKIAACGSGALIKYMGKPKCVPVREFG